MSSWLVIASIGYFLIALEIVIDKFLLSSKRVSHPSVYAFYSGTLGLFALVFSPFGFHLVSAIDAALMLLTGAVFIYGMLALFFAINESEASRVMPVLGATIPVITLFLSMIFLGEKLGAYEITGVILLIIGGLLISIDLPRWRSEIIFSGFRWAVMAGVLLAFSATVFKNFYNSDNFLNVYIWTRSGAFLGVLTFFLVPLWRKKILSSLSHFKNPKREEESSGAALVLAKIFGGTGSIMKEKAVSLSAASVTVVNALVSLEYVFIFLLGIIFSFWLPKVFTEEKGEKTERPGIKSVDARMRNSLGREQEFVDDDFKGDQKIADGSDDEPG